MTEDWTEKYRPKSLSDVKGNPSAVKELEEWAKSWTVGIPKKRAVILMGAPGIGKTSSAEALANDMGWDIVEMNASDQRTGNSIREVALRASYFNTLGTDEEYKSSKDGGKKLIVLDEADNLFGNADRGALPAINELIKTTRQPVILIVNDFYALSRKSSVVSTDTLQITFRK
ncbi:MAG: AAA family ATPase, partial [Candidatus Methanoplasma sp.]|nr:AAA family ATPase [Candidatus Methanoplasma sp.]